MDKKYPDELIERAKRVKLFVFDVDGVLTDGRLSIGSYGDEIKNFDVNDGLGIILIKRAGFKCAILTAKASRVVTKRARELKIDKVYHGFHYKKPALEKICRRFKVTPQDVCFMGDDLIDIPVLKRVGLAVSPPGAAEEAKGFAHLITRKKGGRGAVREVCELVLKAQGLWDKVTGRYFE